MKKFQFKGKKFLDIILVAKTLLQKKNVLQNFQVFAYNVVHAQSLFIKESRVTLKVLSDGRFCTFLI